MIDIMKPLQQPYREVFKHVVTVTREGEKCKIPTLEMGIAMKFSAMTSLHRAPEDRYRDAHDFIRMVRERCGRPRSGESSPSLASSIYPEGGKDVLEMVKKVRAGEMLQL